MSLNQIFVALTLLGLLMLAGKWLRVRVALFGRLFLGKTIPGPRTIWRRAGPMVAHGQTLAWGQYVIGLLLVLVLLTPVFGVSPMAGALIEIGFEGGHGTAAGLAGTFRDLGFESGADLALSLATLGVVAGVLLGTLLVNWGVRTGRLSLQEVDTVDLATSSCCSSRWWVADCSPPSPCP